MNKSIAISAAALAAWGWAASASAAPVAYEGPLAAGSTVTGTAGGFAWFLEQGAGMDFWQFAGTAGSQITLQGVRLNANLDPALSLYLGSTAADASLFRATADWGGLTFLASADDEVARALRGGDPLLAGFVLPATGTYTVAIGGALSSDAGPYPYQLTLAGGGGSGGGAGGQVPLPATAWLLGAGLAAGLGLRWRTPAVPR